MCLGSVQVVLHVVLGWPEPWILGSSMTMQGLESHKAIVCTFKVRHRVVSAGMEKMGYFKQGFRTLFFA